mmetsp:Transcript_9374/g.23352  ORF Transcript_9374/g.23352 Transcript_9374/m.23352 type:complete len:94 (+) Transcript_9374:1306-1587(+)
MFRVPKLVSVTAVQFFESDASARSTLMVFALVNTVGDGEEEGGKRPSWLLLARRPFERNKRHTKKEKFRQLPAIVNIVCVYHALLLPLMLPLA